MKQSGIYMNKSTGDIWLVDELEHYPASVIPDGSGEFSIIISGIFAGREKIKRCLITKDQYKWFYRIGDL